MTRKPSPILLIKRHFFVGFIGIIALLAGVRRLFPEVTHFSFFSEAAEQAAPLPQDTIALASARADSLLRRRRTSLRLLDKTGSPVKHPILSVPAFDTAFPDLNDVQLATARRIGISECADRAEAAQRIKDLVYIGDSPFYELKKLTHSTPYLVPRAATLLNEIGRSFLDSLASKGLPFHKLKVTSVLRTNEDIERLRRHNGNASEQSCHRFGTTFDISYNFYRRVQDPALPPQPETWGVQLKSVLAEVLDDQRRMGTCYVKYEVHQSCFHITAR